MCGAIAAGPSQLSTTQLQSDEVGAVGSSGAVSVRTSVRQQPIFAICPQLPCMARQQALSS